MLLSVCNTNGLAWAINSVTEAPLLAGSLAQQIFIRLGAAQYAASRKYRIQTMVNGRVVTSLTTFIIMLAPHFRSFQVMTYLKSNLNSGIGLF